MNGKEHGFEINWLERDKIFWSNLAAKTIERDWSEAEGPSVTASVIKYAWKRNLSISHSFSVLQYKFSAVASTYNTQSFFRSVRSMSLSLLSLTHARMHALTQNVQVCVHEGSFTHKLALLHTHTRCLSSSILVHNFLLHTRTLTTHISLSLSSIHTHHSSSVATHKDLICWYRQSQPTPPPLLSR